MAKRPNESSQIRREDYEAQELDETVSVAERGFEKASNDLLRQRRIVKARNVRQPSAPSSIIKPLNESPIPSNPFANFRGLVAANKSMENTQTNSPIGATYDDEMKKLNEEFVRLIDKQRIERPNGSWKGEIQDYLKRAAAIKANHITVEPNASRPKSSQSLMQGTTQKEDVVPVFSFGKPVNAEPKLNAFASSSANLNLFKESSQAKSDEKEVKAAEVTSNKSEANKTTFGVFGTSAFGANTTFPSFLHSAKKEDNPVTISAEDDENIGQEEATVILKSESADDNCVFDADKSKLYEFKKDENRWADKGTNALQVLTSKTTGRGRILIRNQIGTIVLNAGLYKGMKITPHEANGKKTGVIVLLQAESGSMTQYLIKVSTDKVEDLISALEKALPE
uniref:Uncharacterized protein AlNc14C160G7764 n=1 Tax=Albugo laibachii Nc14 TaxID=890382 RepID=F0WMS8_9STRA|nr:conserved hypothetical protein [Albugo laibachii Nc14]|eukprot:CCA22613.1 conserved hypothetical protein [Albugo laibachii Nc14]